MAQRAESYSAVQSDRVVNRDGSIVGGIESSSSNIECIITPAGYRESGKNKSVHLRRLEEMEGKYLVSVFGRKSAPHLGVRDANNIDPKRGLYDDAVLTEQTDCPITVNTLHYKPLPQTHSVEVYTTITSTSAEVIYDLKVSAIVDSVPYSSVLSGHVDYILPNTTVTIVALFSLPQGIFFNNCSTDVCVHVAINWRCGFQDATHPNGKITQEDAHSSYTRVINGWTPSR